MYHKVGLVYTIWLWLTVCHGKSPFLRTVKLYFYGLFPMALVPFQSTWLAHFPDDLMVKSGMPRQQGWHGGPERHRNRNLHSNLASSWRHSHFERLFFEAFSNLELGILGYFYHQKVEFLGILPSKLGILPSKLQSNTGISWDLILPWKNGISWDFMGFHGISWDFMGFWWNLDGGLYIVGVIFVGFVTIVDNFTPRTWEMICVKELDPPCSWEASESHKFKDEFCAFEVHCGHSEVEVPFIQCLGAFWSVAQGPKLFRYKTSPWPIPVGKWLKKRFFLAPYANRVGRILSSYHWGSIPRVKNTSDLGSTEHVPFFPTGCSVNAGILHELNHRTSSKIHE